MLIYLVAGARPNFMKIAPIVRALQAQQALSFKIIHTGQHYDRDMNEVFFEELGIPQPDLFMAAGGGSHAQQTAKIMIGFEELCTAEPPAAVLVVGDVNSTLACSIVAKKLNIPVAHVEAGLRSGDMSMPEEINRLVTDSISDWFFVTEPAAVDHLRREGKPDSAIHYVGHVMVDNVLFQADKLTRADTSGFETAAFKAARGEARRALRRGHLAPPEQCRRCRSTSPASPARCKDIAAELPLIFPVHPRTRANLEKFGIDLGPNITLAGPQAYMAFLNLWKDAAVVLTDSGGLQEETTALGVPCVTIRENTERPVTVDEGSNVLAGTDPVRIVAEARKVLRGEGKQGKRPAPVGRQGGRAHRRHPGPRTAMMTRTDHHDGLPGRQSVDGGDARARSRVSSAPASRTSTWWSMSTSWSRPAATRELRRIINDCALVNVDGMPVVWASRLLGKPLKERVAGVDLFEALMRRAGDKGWRVFLLGAREEVVQAVRATYQRKYPQLAIAGCRNGYWSGEQEEAAVAEQVRASRADLLFVAISSPKKEQFLGRYQGAMQVPFAMGVGGTFDVADRPRQAGAAWMQKAGLEWFYRFLQEPRRMFRRYFIDDMAFIWLLIKEAARR